MHNERINVGDLGADVFVFALLFAQSAVALVFPMKSKIVNFIGLCASAAYLAYIVGSAIVGVISKFQ